MFAKRQVISVDAVNSTNELAAQLLASGNVPEGSIVIARDQTAGRGQFGSLWWSEPGNSLTLSIVLKPEFLAPTQLFALNMAVSIAACEFISDTVRHQALIKWPNDIVCRGSKVCGVLIENSIIGERVRHSIVGIGVNLNQQTFPPFLPGATSLRVISGLDFDPESLIDPLSEAMAKYYDMLRSDGDQLRQVYHERLHGLGKKQLFSRADHRFLATITGVSDSGRLELEMDDDSRETFAVKEVVFVQ